MIQNSWQCSFDVHGNFMKLCNMADNQRHTLFHIVSKVSSPPPSYDDRWWIITLIITLVLSQSWNAGFEKDQSHDPFKRSIARSVKWRKGNRFILTFLARFLIVFCMRFHDEWNVCYKNLGSKYTKRLSTLECGFIRTSKRNPAVKDVKPSNIRCQLK